MHVNKQTCALTSLSQYNPASCYYDEDEVGRGYSPGGNTVMSDQALFSFVQFHPSRVVDRTGVWGVNCCVGVRVTEL